jgi:nitrogen regulatory protein PII
MNSGGAGRIYVTELHDAVKIWTGERGNRAL